MRGSTIPPEPPEAAIPTKSAELVMNYHQVSHHHPSSHVVPNDTSDDKSIATNDYNAIFSGGDLICLHSRKRLERDHYF